jgi:hypothetical protein
MLKAKDHESQSQTCFAAKVIGASGGGTGQSSSSVNLVEKPIHNDE